MHMLSKPLHNEWSFQPRPQESKVDHTFHKRGTHWFPCTTRYLRLYSESNDCFEIVRSSTSVRPGRPATALVGPPPPGLWPEVCLDHGPLAPTGRASPLHALGRVAVLVPLLPSQDCQSSKDAHGSTARNQVRGLLSLSLRSSFWTVRPLCYRFRQPSSTLGPRVPCRVLWTGKTARSGFHSSSFAIPGRGSFIS